MKRASARDRVRGGIGGSYRLQLGFLYNVVYRYSGASWLP